MTCVCLTLAGIRCTNHATYEKEQVCRNHFKKFYGHKVEYDRGAGHFCTLCHTRLTIDMIAVPIGKLLPYCEKKQGIR